MKITKELLKKEIPLPSLRRIHLYLGVLCAPMILLFAISGAIQTLGLHHKQNKPSKFIKELASIHQSMGLQEKVKKTHTEKEKSLLYFRRLSFFLGLGLTTSTLIGIKLAFQSSPRKIWVWICLLVGSFLPITFIFL